MSVIGVGWVGVLGGAGVPILVLNQSKHLGQFKHAVKVSFKPAKRYLPFASLFCKNCDNFMTHQ